MIDLFYVSILSLLLNAALLPATFYFYRKARQAGERRESLELQEFLGDMMNGGGLIKVTHVGSADALIRVRNRR